jgi:hypothetical protein
MPADDFGIDENAGMDMAGTIVGATRRPLPAAFTTPPPPAPAITAPQQLSDSIFTPRPDFTAINSNLKEAQSTFASRSAILQGGLGAGPGMAIANDATSAIVQGKEQLAILDARHRANVQAMNAQVQAAFGDTPGSASMVAIKMAQSVKEMQGHVEALDTDLANKLKVGFTDNPVQWLVNQFTMPHEATQLKFEEGRLSQRLEITTKLAQMMDSANKLNEYSDQQDYAARATALSKIAYGEARMNLAQDAFRNAQLNNEVINTRSAMDERTFNSTLQLNNALNQSTAASIAFDNLEIHKHTVAIEDQKFTIDQAREFRAQREAAQQEEIRKVEFSSANLNNDRLEIAATARADLNSRILTVAKYLNFAPMTIEQLQMLPDVKFKQLVLEMMVDPDLQQNGRYGADPYLALQRLDVMPGTLTAGVQYARDRLHDMYMGAISSRGGPQAWKSYDIDARHQIANQYMIQEMNKAKAIIPDTGGLFSPDNLAQVTKNPNLKGSVILGEMQALSTGNPTYALKAQDVMASAVNLLNQKKIDLGQAVEEITKIYKLEIMDVNGRNALERFGARGLNEATGFNQNVQLGVSYISGQSRVNMANKAEVQAALIRMQGGQAAAETFIAPPM